MRYAQRHGWIPADPVDRLEPDDRLRHTFASHLILDLRLDVAQVGRILGHARVTIILDVYTHLFDDARHTDEIRALMTASPFAGRLASTGASSACAATRP